MKGEILLMIRLAHFHIEKSSSKIPGQSLPPSPSRLFESFSEFLLFSKSFWVSNVSYSGLLVFSYFLNLPLDSYSTKTEKNVTETSKKRKHTCG